MYDEKLLKNILAVKKMAEKMEYKYEKYFLYYMDVFGYDMNIYSKNIEIPLNTIIKWADEDPKTISSLDFQICSQEGDDLSDIKNKIVKFEYGIGKNGEITKRMTWKNYFFCKNEFMEPLGNMVGEFYAAYLTEYICERKSELEFFQQNFPAFFKFV